jgi:ribosomal protein S6
MSDQQMREYETVSVLGPELDEAALVGAIERLRNVVNHNGGKVVKVTHWGRKKLAYEIGHDQKGVFVHFSYVAPPTLVHELERNMRLMDSVLRFQTHRLKDLVSAAAYEAETDEQFLTALQSAVQAGDTETEEGVSLIPAPMADEDDDADIEAAMEPVGGDDHGR